MKTKLPYLLYPLLLATSTLAQGIQVKVVADTTLQVKAKNIVKTLPPQTDLSKGVRLSAKADSSNVATLQTSFSHKAGQTVFQLSEQGSGQGFFQPNVRTGRHRILLTFQSKIPVTGQLHIQMSWKKTLFSHRAGGNDIVQVGSSTFRILPPFASKVDQVLPVTIDAKGLRILSTSEQWGSNNLNTGTFWYECKLTFTPKMPCSVQSYGKACGSKLQGTAYPTREIALQLSQGFPKAGGLLVLGFTRQAFTIPKTPCLLLTKIAYLGAFLTDAQGSSAWILPLPPGIALKFQVQAATFAYQGSQLLLRTTQGLEISCLP